MRFADVIGQDDVKRRLRSSFREGRIAHALLFLGPEGSGALSVALAFAQYVLCTKRTEEDSCGECPSCRKMNSLQHADLHFSFPYFNIHSAPRETYSDDYSAKWRAAILEDPYLDLDAWRSRLTSENKQFQIPVSEAGNIVRKLALRSYEGDYKFMVIWAADMIKNDTANKLLKIIEEPPDHTLFFLVAHSTENMLATILSRTQVVQVPRLRDQDIENGLIQNGVDPEKAAQIAHYTQGDWFRSRQLAAAQDPNALFFEQFQRWMRMCYSRDAIAIIRWAEEMTDLSRDDQKHFLTYALDQIRQNLILNYAGEELARMSDNEKAFSIKFSRFINDLNAQQLMEVLNDAHLDIGRNGYAKLIFSDLSFKTHKLLTREAQ
ncbi:MAG: DNA polymerase III subunit delta' [Flavobacteriales bacterium]|nr:DNA polymerase III subunit delta' [Flavobacteriales bacterium]